MDKLDHSSGTAMVRIQTIFIFVILNRIKKLLRSVFLFFCV